MSLAPHFASTPAELLSAMRALRRLAALTYRELEVRAQAVGDRLPRALIPRLMANNDLPRESTLASFVRACAGEHEVEPWLAVRRRIASGTEVSLADQVEAWLTQQSVEVFEGPAAPLTYTQGRVGQAAATARGDRWVGLHRRPRRWPLRRRADMSHS